MARWWAGRTRQFVRHVTGRVSSAERAALAAWLSAPQLALFDAMHPADRRHGLDVVEALRRDGHDDPDLLLAGLFHDAGKGTTVGLWHRVGWSLGERYGPRAATLVARLPGFRRAFERIARHAEESARSASAAGCSDRTAALIRDQATPRRDDPLARALLLADEAN